MSLRIEFKEKNNQSVELGHSLPLVTIIRVYTVPTAAEEGQILFAICGDFMPWGSHASGMEHYINKDFGTQAIIRRMNSVQLHKRIKVSITKSESVNNKEKDCQ